MRSSILLILFIFNTLFTCSQSQVIESLAISSDLLQKDIKYTVYLPDNYDTSKADYSVLYLLHGSEGNETDWIKTGQLQKTVDDLIELKKIQPLIIIMPDGDDRLNMNKDDGSYPYEDMFITEFIPKIEQRYRISKKKESRAIGGLSMGGAGSLRLAMRYPDLFGSCFAFSAGISTDEELMNEAQDSFDAYFGNVSPSVIGKKGKDRINNTLKDYDVLRLAQSLDESILKSLNIYFDAGDDDLLTTVSNGELHKILIQRNIPHEYRVRNGGHDWEYWKASLPYGLEFVNQHLKH